MIYIENIYKKIHEKYNIYIYLKYIYKKKKEKSIKYKKCKSYFYKININNIFGQRISNFGLNVQKLQVHLFA